MWGCVREAPLPTGNAAVAARYECARCHQAPGVWESLDRDRDCAGCHAAIDAGEYDWRYDAESVAAWKARVNHLVDVPSLQGASRLRPEWIASFLREPHDLRPGLEETMPRLAVSEADAAALAALLTEGVPARPPLDLSGADVVAGQRLASTRGCGACHLATGLPALAVSEVSVPVDDLAAARVHAPDLRFARVRMTPEALDAFLADPRAVKADARMPAIPLSPTERRDVVAWLVQAEFVPLAVALPPARPALLARPVGYDEVFDRVFRTCRHCHSDPKHPGNAGDGGPGNTGGFGYTGKGLDFSTWEGTTGTGGLTPRADGTPRVVAHLLARHAEQAGAPVPGVLGMPLGLPAIPLEDVALVDTWIAQGAPR